MPYVLSPQISDDTALFDLASHWDVGFIGGRPLPEGFTPPVKFNLDVDLSGRMLPTFFTTPAFAARKSFAELLKKCGIDNIEVCPAVIHNPESGETIDDYVVINIVGLVACADLQANPGADLGPDLRMIDSPVLRKSALGNALMFRLAEDSLQIVIADSVAERIRAAGIEDAHLEKLEISE